MHWEMQEHGPEGEGDRAGEGIGEGVGDGVGLGVGEGVGDGVGEGVAVGVAGGGGSTVSPANVSVNVEGGWKPVWYIPQGPMPFPVIATRM